MVKLEGATITLAIITYETTLYDKKNVTLIYSSHDSEEWQNPSPHSKKYFYSNMYQHKHKHFVYLRGWSHWFAEIGTNGGYPLPLQLTECVGLYHKLSPEQWTLGRCSPKKAPQLDWIHTRNPLTIINHRVNTAFELHNYKH